jgi:hypothetical protein
MDKHYKEMDDYIARCQAAGLPKTKEEAARRHKEFEEIQSRMNRCAVGLMKRVRSGDQAPHLRKVE